MTDADGYPLAHLYLTKETNAFFIWLVTETHVQPVDWFPRWMRDQAFIDAVHLSDGPYEEIVRRAANITRRSHPYREDEPREDDD